MDELTVKEKRIVIIALIAVIVVGIFFALIPGGEQCDCDGCQAEREQAEWERDNGIRSDGGTDGW